MTRLAIAEAQQAIGEGNPPYGSAVVLGDKIIGRGHNRMATNGDPTAHAEVEALRDAARAAGQLLLPGATVFTSCEPCLMCTGALIGARVSRVVIGACWADAPEYFNHPRARITDQRGAARGLSVPVRSRRTARRMPALLPLSGHNPQNGRRAGMT